MDKSLFDMCFIIYKQVYIIANSLEKRSRYSLGSSIENSVLVFTENVTQAKHASKNTRMLYLIKANATLDIIRLKMRLILEIKGCNESLLFTLDRDIDEAGRMLGGWIRSHKS